MGRAARFVLLLAAAQAQAQQLCWDTKPGYNAVSQLVRTPKTEQRPQLFYFGETSGPMACRAACEAETACAAFTWMGKGEKSGWLGGGAKWSLQCYGRGKYRGRIDSAKFIDFAASGRRACRGLQHSSETPRLCGAHGMPV